MFNFVLAHFYKEVNLHQHNMFYTKGGYISCTTNKNKSSRKNVEVHDHFEQPTFFLLKKLIKIATGSFLVFGHAVRISKTTKFNK